MAKPASGTALDSGSSLFTSLKAVWGMLEGSGTTSADSTGNGFTLTNVGSNGTAWGTDQGGVTAITFGGAGVANAALAVTTGFSFAAGGTWSIAWRGHQTNSGSLGMVLGDASVTSDFLWMDGGSFFRFRDSASDDNDWTGNTTFTTDADYLLVRDNTANTLTLYKDGTAVTGGPVNAGGGTLGGLGVKNVGNAYTSTTFALAGSLTYAYVWANRALSSTDASALHSNPYTIFHSGAAATFAPLLPLLGVG